MATKLVSVSSIAEATAADAVVYVATKAGCTSDDFGAVTKAVADASAADAAFAAGAPGLVVADGIPGRRVIVSLTGPLDRDYDDVRRVADAVEKGIKRARAAGSVAPLLVLSGTVKAGPVYARALDAALASALAALYVSPVAITIPKPVSTVFFLWAGVSKTAAEIATAIKLAEATEVGRKIARDIGGGDPERMAAPACASYIEEAFKAYPSVKVVVDSDHERMRTEYPCVHAVARASIPVPRHHPRIVRLEYTPPVATGPVTRTIYLAGKGVTYDTGGVDVKVGGAMVGMSRDKCGAAAAAGFVATLAAMEATGVRCIAYLGFVRNSIGSEAFTSDEIITSHAGKKVMVINTDAEGRMVLMDLLSHIRCEIVAAAASSSSGAGAGASSGGGGGGGGDVVVHSLATLTGHAIIACGYGYTISVENGPARAAGVSQHLFKAGASIGEPFEVSTLRREDYDFVAPKTGEYHVLQCNAAPSSQTPRGHQFPAAVLSIGSGLESHGVTSDTPIAYSHLDIAGSSVLAPFATGITTGCPIAGLVAAYC